MADKGASLRSFRGTVYGDLVGSPYMIENTYNRYFELGETRRAYSHGRVRSFFPEATEVSHGAAAVTSWLTTYRDDPSVENLQKSLRRQFDAHPRGGWTESTRLFLTSGAQAPSVTPDWSAVTRAVPIASFFRDDYFRAMELSEACVRATCADEDTVRMARAVTQAVHMALDGRDPAEIFTRMEMEYGLLLARPEDDLRAELRGEVAQKVTMMGVPVEGAYFYRLPESPAPPSSRLVVEAAIRAVTGSDSWEDAVRRAVALGGPSNAVAGIAGGLAEALYGEVTPSVIGKLYTYIPTDIAHQLESLERAPAIRVRSEGSPYTSIEKDALTLISTGPGQSTYVIPENRKDIRELIAGTFPNAQVIAPAEMDSFLARFDEKRDGTFPYGPRPEIRTLYVQDGERIVSPSHYIAPGMPPLQERKRHLSEFLSLRSWCVERQKEMNALAGNPDAGQIHYAGAYHMWIGTRRIDFLFGDQLAGRVSLDGRGLLKVDLGEYRDISADSRFENHREQSWASRSLFSIPETVDPIGHLSDIRSDILSRLLDDGLRTGLEGEQDVRYLSEDERRDRAPVSNIDHLERLSSEDLQGGLSPSCLENPIKEPETLLPSGKKQGVRTIYTIGYGARSQDAFCNTLQMLGVDTVIDVRSHPASSFAPHFNADTIYEALSGKDIAFFLAGERFGGRPTDLSLYDSGGRVSWDALRTSPAYREGLRSIEGMAEEGHLIAIVSSEGDPLVSHRFGTLSRDLDLDGLDVRHVLTNGEVVPHGLMEDRLLERYKGKGAIMSVTTGNYHQQVEEAYRELNRERGFKPKPRFSRGSYTSHIKR